MFGAGRTRARKPALTKARLLMQNLLHLRVARQSTAFVAASCERRLFFPSMSAARQSRQIWDEKNPAVTERRYNTAGERSRARKSAEKQESNLRSWVCTRPTPARSGLRALP